MITLVGRVPFAWGLLVSMAAVASLRAQCTTAWLPGQGVRGVNDAVNAMTVWDPDGGGPVPARLVAAGKFTLAEGVLASRIATWDPATATWSALGSGLAGSPGISANALATLPNGSVVVAGAFISSAGGVPVSRIASWNGSVWSPLSSGLNAQAFCLTTLPNGDLVAGGDFTSAGGIAASKIARWNGTGWSPLGTGINGTVYSLTALPNGNVVAGGSFSMAGGVAVASIARWDGITWWPMSSGMNGIVRTLATMSNGDVVAGGGFSIAGGVSASNIARWNGTTWSPLATGVNGSVNSLQLLPNGVLMAGGTFTAAGTVTANRIAAWNGATWSSISTGISGTAANVSCLARLPNGFIVAGGTMQTAGAVQVSNIARSNGLSWTAFGSGMNGTVRALATLASGELVAGGDFTGAGTVTANKIARWNGTSWSPLGSGINGTVLALTVLANGDLVAGGGFTTAGGVTANGIARWDGTNWSPLGVGVSGYVTCLLSLPNGDLVAGGVFSSAGGVQASGIARWNGTAWSPLGSGVPTVGLPGYEPPGAYALTLLPNGDLVVAGDFQTAGGIAANRVARWNGSTWSPLGSGLGDASPTVFGQQVRALTTLPNGDVIAGGTLLSGNIMRWDGSSWQTIGYTAAPFYLGRCDALLTLPNGDVVAAGGYAYLGGLSGVNNIARWNGSTWSTFGSGLGFATLGTPVPVVNALALFENGLAAGGQFPSANGAVSFNVATLTTTCPPVVNTMGNGCPSSGGNNTLAATGLPWIGSTVRTVGTGLPVLAFVIEVTGSTSIPQGTMPLSTLLPPSAPGCDLLVSPDVFVDLSVTTTGTFTGQVQIPSLTAVVGMSLYHQLIALELNPGLAGLTTTATNALELVVGTL